MSTKHKLTVLFICGFALLTDSKRCERNLAEGDSCIIMEAQKSDKQIDANSRIKWTLSSGTNIFSALRDGEKLRTKIPQATIESDGYLKLQNVKLNNTGKYKFEVYNNEDKVIASGEQEITVYEKALKPYVTFVCHSNESATVTCETQIKDISVSWLSGKEQMKHENNRNLYLTSTQLKDNQQYSCIVSNPVSNAQSDNLTVCGPDLLFGVHIWVMVGILAGGGAVILLVILVLIICALRSCKKGKKRQDEEELRLRTFHTPPTEQRTKSTARGQPAPPIPQEDSLHPTPTTQTPNQTRAQPKGQVRARPPPPPQDEDEEDPPPLPRPRKKHREKRNQEPYQPME